MKWLRHEDLSVLSRDQLSECITVNAYWQLDFSREHFLLRLPLLMVYISNGAQSSLMDAWEWGILIGFLPTIRPWANETKPMEGEVLYRHEFRKMRYLSVTRYLSGAREKVE